MTGSEIALAVSAVAGAPLVVALAAGPVSAVWTALCARLAHAWSVLLLAACCTAPGVAQAAADAYARLTHRPHRKGHHA